MPVIDSTLTVLILWAVIGYGFGSIPFGMVLAKLMNLGNLREIGSGNIGATNVLRTGNKLAALGTLVLDGGKGAVAVLIARALAGEDTAQLAGLMAFLGHCYPVWLGFKGGKGVATFLGLMLALAFPVGVLCCLAWLVTAGILRISSLSAIVAAASSTFWVAFFGPGAIILLSAVLTLLVFWRHRENIARLRAGTEPKIGQK